jgi:hypothetical protein
MCSHGRAAGLCKPKSSIETHGQVTSIRTEYQALPTVVPHKVSDPSPLYANFVRISISQNFTKFVRPSKRDNPADEQVGVLPRGACNINSVLISY